MRIYFWPALLLIFLVPVFWKIWKAALKPAILKHSILLRPSGPRQKIDSTTIRLVLRVMAFVCIVIALARPQSSFKTTERKVSGIDIMLVMDVSASMNIEDMGERSRLDLAKETIENFVKGRQNDRIGFLMFSGEPLTLAPPTLDYGIVIAGVREADTGVLKDGTAIGDGLSLAINRLRTSVAKSRVIVLLTDGDNNLGQVDPGTAGELAAGYGIRVYTIAIGREGRVKIPIKRKGLFGNNVVTYQWMDNALNPELLQKIAAMTNGRFYRVVEEQALEKVFKEIDQLEKSDVKATEKVQYEEIFSTFLKIGLLLLFLESALNLLIWRTFP